MRNTLSENEPISAWINNLILAAFVAVGLYSLWMTFVGWGTPIVQQHEFVQAKAAIAAYCSVRSPPERTDVPINAGGVFEEPYFALARS